MMSTHPNICFWDEDDDELALPPRCISPISSSSSSAGDATLGNDFSSIVNQTADDSREEAARSWVRVSHLEPSTTEDALRRLFYPYGGDEVLLLREPDAGLVGYVGFDSTDMCALAVEKMHAFIPCRQTQALSVRAVPREVAHAARAAAARAQPHKPTPPPAEPLASVESVAAAVRDAPSPAVIERIIIVVTTAAAGRTHAEFATYREELLKLLLRALLSEAGALPAAWVVNSGVAVGLLFARGVLPGDPFLFANRLLQRCPRTTAHFDAICGCAHACGALAQAASRDAFWAEVAQLALATAEPDLRAALLAHLHRALPSCVGQPAADDGRQRARTVYVSHLPPSLPQRVLRDVLFCCGDVNKVRVCRSPGYKTLFAFVEMADMAGVAQVMQHVNGINMYGHTLRVQMAHSPVQDFFKEDAQYRNGAIVQPCLFGCGNGSIVQCLSACPKPAANHHAAARGL